MKLTKNHPLKKHTAFKIGGRAKVLAVPSSSQKLQELLKKNKLPVFVLGGGSNVLVSDKGFDGLAIKTTNLDSIIIKGNRAVVGSGTRLSKLIQILSKKGLSGLENLAGIPGTVGGAVKGNTGAFGKTVGEIVDYVKIFTTKGISKTLRKKDLKFSYRKSNISGIIYEVGLKLKKAPKNAIEKRIREVLSSRRINQPWGKPCAGSIFKNPSGKYSAGELIEKAGLKGCRVGDAEISKKHANFIVNCGKAKATDIIRLMKLIQKKVYGKFKVKLRLEIILLN